jgi:hypothetical protein
MYQFQALFAREIFIKLRRAGPDKATEPLKTSICTLERRKINIVVHSEFLDDFNELIFFVSTESLVTERLYASKPFCVPDEEFAENTDAPFFAIVFNDKI